MHKFGHIVALLLMIVNTSDEISMLLPCKLDYVIYLHIFSALHLSDRLPSLVVGSVSRSYIAGPL